MLKHHSKITLTRRTALKIGVLTTASLVIGVSPLQKFQVTSVQAAGNTESSPKQLGFSHNQNTCIGCRSCEYACKKLYKWEEGVKWRTVYTQTTEDKPKPFFLSMSCNHCADPACLKVCPVGAYTKREKDGIVVQDSSRCVGCGYCLYACPYHAPQLGKTSGAVSKCSFCYQRQDNGETPACVDACPTKALKFGDVEELKKQEGAVFQISGMPTPKITNPSFVIIPKKG